MPLQAIRLCGPMASDGAGGAILSWLDVRAESLDFEAYSQRLNEAGEPQWTFNGQTTGTAAGDQYPGAVFSIVSDGSGGAILTWEDGCLDEGGT